MKVRRVVTGHTPEGKAIVARDTEVEVHLRAGDTVVQNGTRHPWRNKSALPCQLVVALIGAHLDVNAEKF